MKDVSVDDVIDSILAADSKLEARKIVDRYSEYLRSKRDGEAAAERWKMREERLRNSSFTKVIEHVDSVAAQGWRRPPFLEQPSGPSNRDVLIAIKRLAEALREREELLFRRGPG